MQVSSSFGRKTRRLPDDVVPKGEQGIGYEREETVTGTGMGAGTGTRSSTELNTRWGIGARAEAGEWTRVKMSAEGIDSLGTFEVVIEAGRKSWEGGRRQRVSSNHSPEIRHPGEIVASCAGLEPGDRGGARGMIRKGGEKARKRKDPRIVIYTMRKTGKTWAAGENQRRQDSSGSVHFDP